MPRFKSNKDYAIRLIHPEFGEYYYSYSNNNYSYYNNNFVFTKNLKKVTTWKTFKCAEKLINNMSSNLGKNNSKIILPFGYNVPEELKLKLECSMKKYFYYIKSANSITSKIEIDRAEKNIEVLNNSILPDIENITQLIKDNKHIEKDFMNIMKNLIENIHSYRKDYSILEKNKKLNLDSNLVYLDIVDASFGFRRLKLKTLKAVETEE